MKEIKVSEVAPKMIEALPKGILLNSKSDKFNSMVIGWGVIGVNWSTPIVTVFVREHRYTRHQLDENPEFTLSIPLEGVNPTIQHVCGSISGRDVDKEKEANLTLVDARKVSVPAVKEYPLTLECKIIQKQPMDLSTLDATFLKYYPKDVDGLDTGSNQDTHIAYTAEIVASYMID